MVDLRKIDIMINELNSMDYAMCSNMDDCTCTVCSAAQMLEQFKEALRKRPPSEKPERDASVLVELKTGGISSGVWLTGVDFWATDTDHYTDDEVAGWWPLSAFINSADK